MPVKALEKAMTRAIALKKKTGDSCQRLGKGDDKGSCLEDGEALPVKALEKTMTRAIALKKWRRCRSKPCKRQ